MRMLGDLDRFVRLAEMQVVDDRVAEKLVAPALELIVLDKALRGELDREGPSSASARCWPPR